jgi:hypothetical protein
MTATYQSGLEALVGSGQGRREEFSLLATQLLYLDTYYLRRPGLQFYVELNGGGVSGSQKYWPAPFNSRGLQRPTEAYRGLQRPTEAYRGAPEGPQRGRALFNLYRGIEYG